MLNFSLLKRLRESQAPSLRELDKKLDRLFSLYSRVYWLPRQRFWEPSSEHPERTADYCAAARRLLVVVRVWHHDSGLDYLVETFENVESGPHKPIRDHLIGLQWCVADLNSLEVERFASHDGTTKRQAKRLVERNVEEILEHVKELRDIRGHIPYKTDLTEISRVA